MDSPTINHAESGKSPQPSDIAGFQKVYQNERDDNLPEVYVSDDPHAIPNSETHQADVYSDGSSPKFSVAETLKNPVDPDDEGTGGSKGSRICGLRRKWFFIVLGLILVIVIAAAVGGGVGGAVAKNASKKGSGDSDGSEDNESPSPTSTAGSSSATSSPSSTPTPTFLNNQTTPQDSFGFQGFSDPSYDGNSTDIIKEEGNIEFDFDIASYVWLPDDSGCCISFCLNETMEGMVGWRCGSRYQEESSEAFGRIYVWCGERQVKESARCGDVE